LIAGSRSLPAVTAIQKIFWLRLVTTVGLCLPALDLAWRWYSDDLGPRPVTEATHSTGDWAVTFVLLSLFLTPARALFDWAPLVQIRRRIGVAAALYAGAHFLIYVLDQKWDLIVVATEIAKRFYLTIGFSVLLVLAALAITSTNGWQRRLRRNWKRLHWLIYPAAFVAIVHFFIQSKLKIGEPAFATGLFAWLMLWRLLPPKLRTSFLGLAILAVTATLCTVVFEAGWYWLVNGIDPLRVLPANLDPELAPRPAHKVLVVSLLVIVAVALRRAAPGMKRLFTRRYIRSTIPAP
jgi:sulfoxide reductase heme-binding subunit YedZ